MLAPEKLKICHYPTLVFLNSGLAMTWLIGVFLETLRRKHLLI